MTVSSLNTENNVEAAGGKVAGSLAAECVENSTYESNVCKKNADSQTSAEKIPGGEAAEAGSSKGKNCPVGKNDGTAAARRSKPRRTAREKKHGRIRLITQALFAALSNGYFMGFVEKKIYQGPMKQFCHPGMNCYSCPGALLSCPIGSLQNALSVKDFRAVLYVAGILTVIGTVCGRFVCGFLCPFGLLQDLIYKIPFFKKFRRLPGEKYLRLLRYFFLALFVLILPLFVSPNGVGAPWFCKYICPVGTLEGGIPLVLLNKALLGITGFLYRWKIAILLVILLGSLLVYRPFCRYICPLGALYGLFNRFSLISYTISQSECTSCKKCQKTCNLDIPVYLKPNSVDCIRCGDCIASCPTGALKPHFLLSMAKQKPAEKK